MDFVGEAVLVEDRELVHRFFPISIGSAPVGSDVSQVLRPDVIQTQGPELCEVEFGSSSLNNSGGAHACQ